MRLWRRVFEMNVDMVNVPDGLDFFAYFFVGFLILVIVLIIIKKLKSRIEREKEYPRLSACKYKVVKKRSYIKRKREHDIKNYYIDCEDNMGRIVEFKIKEWQFYDIEQGEYVWFISKYGIISEIGRANGKNMITNYTRQLPLMDVFEYRVIYKSQEDCDDKAYYIDCIDKENKKTQLHISKRQYNNIEKDDNIIVIYKNGKLKNISKM